MGSVTHGCVMLGALSSLRSRWFRTTNRTTRRMRRTRREGGPLGGPPSPSRSVSPALARAESVSGDGERVVQVTDGDGNSRGRPGAVDLRAGVRRRRGLNGTALATRRGDVGTAADELRTTPCRRPSMGRRSYRPRRTGRLGMGVPLDRDDRVIPAPDGPVEPFGPLRALRTLVAGRTLRALRTGRARAATRSACRDLPGPCGPVTPCGPPEPVAPLAPFVPAGPFWPFCPFWPFLPRL